MSCPNPIYHMEFSVTGPHSGLDHGYVVVWFHRARGARSYIKDPINDPGRMARCWVRGMRALMAFTARTFPELMKREVIYVPK